MEDVEDYEQEIEEYKERIINNLQDFDTTNEVDQLNKIKSIKKSIESMEENTKFYKQAIQRLSLSVTATDLMENYNKYMAQVEEFKKNLKEKRNKLNKNIR